MLSSAIYLVFPHKSRGYRSFVERGDPEGAAELCDVLVTQRGIFREILLQNNRYGILIAYSISQLASVIYKNLKINAVIC